MLDSCYSFAGLKASTVVLPTYVVIVAKLLNLRLLSGKWTGTYVEHTKHFKAHLTIKLFSRRNLVCPCGQLQILVQLEGVDFGAGDSVHHNRKLTSLSTVILLFQHFQVQVNIK